ncbi:protein maturation by [4Fe-4S] cluster transfer protein [Malassezia pachydermatis]
MSLLLSLFRGARLSTSQAWRSSTLAPLRPFHAATTLLDASSPEEKQQTIVRILTEKFQPSDLQVQDVSGGCGSFFAIMIKAKAFSGKSTIQSHRLVNKEIKEVIQDIHGLQLKTIADKK